MRTQWLVRVCAGIALVLVIAFTGFSDAADPLAMQLGTAVPAGTLQGADTIGQTFVFHYPRLYSLRVRWIVSEDFACSPASIVTLHLRRYPGDATDVAAVSIALNSIRHNDFIAFAFPPIPDSQDQAYSFFLDVAQAEIQRGYVSVWASGEDIYPDGQMYLGAVPTDRDLAFQASYAPDAATILPAVVDVAVQHARTILFAVIVWLIPGLVLVLGFGVRRDHPIETVALAGATSLAGLSSVAIVLLWLGAPVVWLVAVVIGAVIALGVAAIRAGRGATWLRPKIALVDGALIALILFSFGVGLAQIRDVLVPLWVDSPAHAGYIKAFLDQGRLPLHEIYHLGYHSIAAALVQIAGVSIPSAMLILGQLLITQTGLSVYLLAKKLAGHEIAGLASAVVVWFLSPTPAYFVTWGRYPLLLGVAILPVAWLFAIEWIEQPRVKARLFLVVTSFAGLAFAQIRLVAFYLAFVTLFIAIWIWRSSSDTRRATLARLGLVIALGITIGAIWLSALLGSSVSWQAILSKNAAAALIDNSVALSVVLSHHGREVLALAVLGSLIALARRRILTWIVTASFVILYGVSLIADEYLPSSLVILLVFLPAALLLGELAAWLFASSRGFAVVGIVMLVLMSLLGARDMVSIANPETNLFTRADEQAMDWIESNTPTSARFLINSFAWSSPTYAQADGGAWIPYRANRATIFLDVNSAPANNDADSLARWIDQQRITHIYLGRRPGILTKTQFACQSERYAPVYYRDGVAIFVVKHAASAASELLVSLPFECGK